jgi:hypothetical protein
MSSGANSPTSHASSRTTFEREGFALVPAVLEPPLTAFFWSYIHTKFGSRLLAPGDALVPNTPSDYGDPATDGLLEHLRARFEEICERHLLPTYSYFRLYKRGDTLVRHKDRPACEFSVSLNIGQVPADPWPLYVEGNDGAREFRLLPGDGVLYRGIERAHWREPFEGQRLAQIFLHYVDRDGPHAGEKYDGRKSLMRPGVRSKTDAGRLANGVAT